jgi:hypothetical protein
VALGLVYQALVQVLGWLALLARSDTAKVTAAPEDVTPPHRKVRDRLG